MKVLTPSQVEHFLSRGHIVMPGCFTLDQVQDWIDLGWERLGYNPDDPSTWEQKRVHQHHTVRVPVREFAPSVFDAICDLCGGEDRLEEPWWGDSFIWNLGIDADKPWQSPEEREVGWHKDGDFFRHFLDSPEQGLLTIVLFSDIAPRGGGTFLACDSVAPVARHLADRPEGVLPMGFPFLDLKHQCGDFVEASGKVGDVVLIHPYLLHAASQNVLGTARIITNPPVHLKEPMQFNRPDGAYSPVEEAVLRALGAQSLDYKPTAPREKIVPERLKRVGQERAPSPQ